MAWNFRSGSFRKTPARRCGRGLLELALELLTQLGTCFRSRPLDSTCTYRTYNSAIGASDNEAKNLEYIDN